MTLRNAIASGHTITVYCPDCPAPRYIKLDLVALAIDLRPYFRCSVCGSKNAGFLMSSAGGDGDWTGGSSN